MARLTGLNPLAYLGVEPLSPPNFVEENRAPTVKDYASFNIGDIWLNKRANNPPIIDDVWMLVSKSGGIATWINFGSGGLLDSLTADVGGPVFPDANSNINIFGTAGHITTTGNPATFTITIDAGGDVATIYQTDAGVAVPAANVLNIFGTSVLNTSGAGNTVDINLTNGANGQVIIGGGAAPAWNNITSLGGTIAITNGANTINLETIAPTAESTFFAYLSATQAGVTGTGTIYTVIYDTELFDVGGDYDNTTGIFTAAIKGQYYFSTNISFISNVNGGTFCSSSFISTVAAGGISGDTYPTAQQVANFTGVNGAIGYQTNGYIEMDIGDTIYSVIVSENGAGDNDDVEGSAAPPPIVTYFFGYLLYKT